jgi:hypothetical protein
MTTARSLFLRRKASAKDSFIDRLLRLDHQLAAGPSLFVLFRMLPSRREA